jgi:hypothetical protein
MVQQIEESPFTLIWWVQAWRDLGLVEDHHRVRERELDGDSGREAPVSTQDLRQDQDHKVSLVQLPASPA